MGKGSSGTNTVTQNSAPPASVLAQYNNVIGQANNVAATPYTSGGFNASNLVAPLNSTQNNAFNTINGLQGIQSPYLSQAQSLLNSANQNIWNGAQQYSPQAIQNYTNPYTSQVVNSTEQQMQNMDAQQQQQVVGNAVSSGAWGGDRSAIAQSELANQQDLANNQTIAGLESQGFGNAQQEFNQQQGAQISANQANAWLASQGAFGESNLGTTALNSGLQGASAQLQSGALQQQQAQEGMNVPYEQFLSQQAYPFQTTGWLSGISTGVGGSEGGTSSTTSPGPSALSQYGGLGLSGLALSPEIESGLGSIGDSLGSLGDIFELAGAAKRGGAVGIRRASGGFMPSFDFGGGVGGAVTPSDAPLGSMLNAQIPAIGSPMSGVTIQPNSRGVMGPPKPPQVQKNQSSGAGGLTADAIKGIAGLSSPSESAIDLNNIDGASTPINLGTAGITPQATSPDGFFSVGSQGGFNGLGGDFNNLNRGGFIPHYDDGGSISGLAPTAQNQNPNMQNMMSVFASMPIEQLQEYSTRTNNPMAKQVLMKRQMMPNTGTQQPSMSGMASPQAFDDGGDVEPAPLSPELQSDMRELYPDAVPAGSSDPAPGFQPPAAIPAPSGASGLAPLPDHDAFMKNYAADTQNVAPQNKVDPRMAMAAAGFAMMAGQSPHALTNIGQGALEGISNYEGQKKEAAAESARAGDVQARGETLYQQMLDERDKVNNENEQLQRQKEANANTASYQQGELGIKKQELAQNAQNQIMERQKPIPDGFGGFIVPNPQDPAHPTQVNMGGAGGDASGASIANIYNPPKDDKGQPLRGEDFAKTIPPMVAAQTRMYVNGDASPPTGYASKPPLLAAHAAAPVYDPSYVGTRFSTIHDFTTSGTQANQTMRSQNATMEHFQVLQSAKDALDNGDTRTFNTIANTIAKQEGKPAPTNFAMAANVVGDEMAKAIVGAKVTQGDRQEFAKNLQDSAGRQQLQGQLDTAGQLMAGQAHTLEKDYNTGTGLDPDKTAPDVYSHLNYRDKFMLPNARKLLEKYYPSDLPSPDKRVAGKTYYGPGGKQGTWTGSGWVPVQGGQ